MTVLGIAAIPGKGLGVVAQRCFKAGERIEAVACIILPEEECGGTLKPYVFGWPDGMKAIALGCGSLYNHSESPNAVFYRLGDRYIEFRALLDISVGEEITIKYA